MLVKLTKTVVWRDVLNATLRTFVHNHSNKITQKPIPPHTTLASYFHACQIPCNTDGYLSTERSTEREIKICALITRKYPFTFGTVILIASYKDALWLHDTLHTHVTHTVAINIPAVTEKQAEVTTNA
jgi:hypothetical protein